MEPKKKVSTHWDGSIGKIIGGNAITGKLGKGGFSTVWLSEVADDSVAIKVFRSTKESRRSYKNEVKIFTILSDFSAKTGASPDHILPYIRTFTHDIHPCIVFKALPISLSRLLKDCDRKYERGLPISVVKLVTRQLLIAVGYLHQCNIVHGDIKPSNVLVNTSFEKLDADPDTIHVYLADFGCSSELNDIYSREVGTTNYMAPELIIESPEFSFPMDIWSLFVTCFELITTDYLFDVYDECDVLYGDDITRLEVEIGDYVSNDASGSSEDQIDLSVSPIDVSPVSECSEQSQSDSSYSMEDEFDPEDVKYHHLLLIAKVIGYPPVTFAENAREYYNRNNKLMKNPDMVPVGIYKLMTENYDMDSEDCSLIDQFLTTGLRYLPSDRVTALDAIKLPWLQ